MNPAWAAALRSAGPGLGIAMLACLWELAAARIGVGRTHTIRLRRPSRWDMAYLIVSCALAFVWTRVWPVPGPLFLAAALLGVGAIAAAVPIPRARAVQRAVPRALLYAGVVYAGMAPSLVGAASPLASGHGVYKVAAGVGALMFGGALAFGAAWGSTLGPSDGHGGGGRDAR